jgi:hypothetical protein
VLQVAECALNCGVLTTQKTVGRTDPKRRRERTARVQAESMRSAQGFIRSCGPGSPRGGRPNLGAGRRRRTPGPHHGTEEARHTSALSPGASQPLDARRAPIVRCQRRFRSCVHPKGAPRERRLKAHAAARPSPGRGRHEPSKPPRAHRSGYASYSRAVGFSLWPARGTNISASSARAAGDCRPRDTRTSQAFTP